jgi:hypothetical protein
MNEIEDKILDHRSPEFEAACEAAREKIISKRLNPNKSAESTYEGYCNAVDKVGGDLSVAAKGVFIWV